MGRAMNFNAPHLEDETDGNKVSAHTSRQHRITKALEPRETVSGVMVMKTDMLRSFSNCWMAKRA
jgi:hypothetical protein